MNLENTSASKKHRSDNLLLRRERERHNWTQGELAERLGTTQVNVSRWEKNITVPSAYYRRKLVELFGKSIQELGFLPEETENAISSATISDLSVQPASQSLWNVPYRRNPFFTGREEILSRLRAAFESNRAAGLTQAQAISGLGGIGKTQIAVEYAYRYRYLYKTALWITASTADALRAEFVLLATLLDLPEQHEQEQDIVVRSVVRWLATHTEWLLILDNVDDLSIVVSLLPVHHLGDVLLTTRLQASGTIAHNIYVEKMGLDEGILFLLRRTETAITNQALDSIPKEVREQAANVVTALDGLPLALDQAGAYIEETRCGVSRYLDIYSTRRKELLLRRGMLPVDHPDSVTATLSLSFQQVEKENATAANLLRLLAFFGSEAIPEEILNLDSVELDAVLGEVTNDPLEIDTVLQLLQRYSLIRRIPEEIFLSIHHLVQAVIKDSIAKEEQKIWKERVIKTLNYVFQEVKLQTWAQCERYIPHVYICIPYVQEYNFIFPEVAQLFNRAATYLLGHARYSQAEQFLLVALTIYRKMILYSEIDNAHTLNDIGVVYYNQGRYQEAESKLQEALMIRQQVLGEEHLDVAQTLYHLADLYRGQGTYVEAEPLYLRALRIREAAVEIDPSILALSYYGLAKLYHSQERYEQAEVFCKRAFSIQEHQALSTHPMLASMLNMLAKIYQGQNKLQPAKEINVRALEIRERISGENHPNVAMILNSLVEIYHAEGNYRDAEPLISRALKIHEETLGLEHPFMAYSLSNLAENFFLRGDYDNALAYYMQALQIRERHRDFTHHHTASIYQSLAKLHTNLGNYEEADMYYRKALSIRKDISDVDHPTVVEVLKQHGDLLRKLNRTNKE